MSGTDGVFRLRWRRVAQQRWDWESPSESEFEISGLPSSFNRERNVDSEALQCATDHDGPTTL